MLYDVRHETIFEYEQTVSISHHVLHLKPRDYERQRCLNFELQIEPQPTHQSDAVDYFGNHVHHLTMQEPHDRLRFESRFRIDVYEPAAPVDLTSGASWETVAAKLASPQSPALEAAPFLFDSPYIARGSAPRDYALPSFEADRPLLDAVMSLTSRIYSEFEYAGGVSDVSTPVGQVLEMRKGVCQDFAHLQIACLRSLGLAARYVSGYLLTHPAPGQPKLVGADASHAWISVWAGELGWIDFDPTNNAIPGAEHIGIGWGRDYGDVSPINGFITGGGAHTLAVSVDVAPAA